ncbi:hypothetical protein ACHWQZ_G019312 [Mnemiopsis leidyi]
MIVCRLNLTFICFRVAASRHRDDILEKCLKTDICAIHVNCDMLPSSSIALSEQPKPASHHYKQVNEAIGEPTSGRLPLAITEDVHESKTKVTSALKKKETSATLDE